jgi:hypothetical protein
MSTIEQWIWKLRDSLTYISIIASLALLPYLAREARMYPDCTVIS